MRVVTYNVHAGVDGWGRANDVIDHAVTLQPDLLFAQEVWRGDNEDQFVALGRFFTFMRTKLFDVHLPDQIPEKGFALLAGKPMIGVGFEPSVLLISAFSCSAASFTMRWISASLMPEFAVMVIF